MSIRGKLYDLLRRATPPSLRQRIKRQPWFMPLASHLLSSDVYSRSYYEDVERIEASSVDPIANWICEFLRPSSMIDVGCGPGHLASAIARRGVTVRCVDISDEALNATSRKGLSVERFDLTVPDVRLPGGPYDLALSCEVAEHLQERYAETFVEKLTGAADTVYLTAAEPEEKRGVGLLHFNEQPNEYWVRLFEQRGFKLDQRMTSSAREHLERNDVISYLAVPMILRRICPA